MDRIWAPWRLEYLNLPKSDACVFCQQGEDRELLILRRTQLVKIMLNRYPYANGHLMVIPNRHVAEPDLLTDAEMLEIFRGADLCRRLLIRASGAEGFNIGMNLGKAAGAGIADHLHLHVVPRWKGDSSFMLTVAETRVLPEALFATYDRLFPLFQEEAEGE